MKRNLIFSFALICLGFLANYTLSNFIDTSCSLAKAAIKLSPITSYVKTDFNLISALKDFGDSRLHSKFGFSNLNPWLNYYRRTGVIRAKKEAGSYVFFDDSNVPAEFRTAVNSAHGSGVLFVSYKQLSEQSLDVWRGNIYAVADSGIVYSIPEGEKQKFISALETKRLAYKKSQDFIWYRSHILDAALLLLLVIWLVPLCHSVKLLYLKLRGVDSFEFNITFKYKK